MRTIRKTSRTETLREGIYSKPRILAGLTLLVFGVLPSLYFRIRVATGIRELNFDARHVWLPFAEHILAGGTPYIPPIVDNKPPGFHIMNTLFAATGHYVTTWVVFVGLMNVLTAVFLVLYLRRRNISWHASWLAGLAYLGTLFATNAHLINDRPAAGALILLALLVPYPLLKGMVLAGACHFSQFSLLALPLLLLQARQDDWLSVRSLGRVAVGGLVVGALPYLLVLVLYGSTAAINSVLWTVGIGPGTVERVSHGTLFVTPLGWVLTLGRNIVQTQPITTLGAASLALVVVRSDWRDYSILFTGVVLFTLPLFAWSYIGYFIFPLIFLSALIGIAVDAV